MTIILSALGSDGSVGVTVMETLSDTVQKVAANCIVQVPDTVDEDGLYAYVEAELQAAGVI